MLDERPRYVAKFWSEGILLAQTRLTRGILDLLIQTGELPEGSRRWGHLTWTRDEVLCKFDNLRHVYFVEMADFIKIGWSADIAWRLKGFETSLPLEVKLLASIPGSRITERYLHEKFAHLRGRGEWFKRDHEILDYIEHLKRSEG